MDYATVVRIAVKHLMAGVLPLMLLTSCAAPTSAVPVRGDDLEGHWAAPYVEALEERGVSLRDESGNFYPEELIGVETFTSWLVNAKYGGGYSEEESVQMAKESNFLNPILLEEDDLTRNTTAQITILALQEMFGEGPENDMLAQQLKDFASCHACRTYTSQCYVKGIMIGRVDRVFDGEKLLTRAEAATIALRAVDPEYRLPPEPDEVEAIVLLSADAARRMKQADENAIILDVRDESERMEGYIPDSVCIPLAQLDETHAAGLAGHENDIIIVYCQSGGRSAAAAALLREAGFTQVYDLGGIGNWTFDLVYP